MPSSSSWRLKLYFALLTRGSKTPPLVVPEESIPAVYALAVQQQRDLQHQLARLAERFSRPPWYQRLFEGALECTKWVLLLNGQRRGTLRSWGLGQPMLRYGCRRTRRLVRGCGRMHCGRQWSS